MAQAGVRPVWREAAEGRADVSTRAAIAKRLRFLADRIDHAGAPKHMSYAFTFEMYRGIVIREGTRQGCPLYYYGDADYERAHNEADDPPPRVDWKALAKGPAT
jgi:hypothetical protein